MCVLFSVVVCMLIYGQCVFRFNQFCWCGIWWVSVCLQGSSSVLCEVQKLIWLRLCICDLVSVFMKCIVLLIDVIIFWQLLVSGECWIYFRFQYLGWCRLVKLLLISVCMKFMVIVECVCVCSICCGFGSCVVLVNFGVLIILLWQLGKVILLCVLVLVECGLVYCLVKCFICVIGLCSLCISIRFICSSILSWLEMVVDLQLLKFLVQLLFCSRKCLFFWVLVSCCFSVRIFYDVINGGRCLSLCNVVFSVIGLGQVGICRVGLLCQFFGDQLVGSMVGVVVGLVVFIGIFSGGQSNQGNQLCCVG